MEKGGESDEGARLLPPQKLNIMNIQEWFKTKGMLLTTVVIALTACSDDNGGTEEPIAGSLLSITAGIETRAVTTTFKNGDRLSVFVKGGQAVTSENYAEPVAATYQGGKWNIAPEVRLQAEAYVFALYPATENTNPSEVAVNVASQTDYLYSGSGVRVSPDAPQANLTMKHALSMVAFNMALSNYNGEKRLTALRMAGEGLYVTGTLDLSTGTITGGEKGSYEMTTDLTVPHDGWTIDLPQMFCLPFLSSGGNVSLTFTLDGKEYNVTLPDVDVKGGMKYLFRLTMKGETLEIADQVEVISLNNNTDVMPISCFLRIGFNGTEAVVPQLQGNQVVGIVNWGDGSTTEAYSYPLSHTYPTEGAYEVSIELSGSSSVEFTKLDDVEYIDLSDY